MRQYCIGEKVVHCPEGVCKVEDICQIETDKIKKEYYRLKPIHSETKAVYIPIDKMETSVRPLRSRQELEKIFCIEPEEKLTYYQNPQKRMLLQRRAVWEDDAVMLIQLIKLYRRRRQNRPISVGDAKWLKEAESYLFSEMSEVFACDYNVLLQCAQYNQTIKCA